MKLILKIFIIAISISFISCNLENSSSKEMISLLSTVKKSMNTAENTFAPEAKLAFYDSVLRDPAS
ncbi:MAG: hypothetical protein WDO19_20710, partial [Bacteroidota bacterium]